LEMGQHPTTNTVQSSHSTKQISSNCNNQHTQPLPNLKNHAPNISGIIATTVGRQGKKDN